MAEMSSVVAVERYGQAAGRREDHVAVEEPLEIRLGPTPLVVTMRTPGHDEELAAGLLLTEGVVRLADDIVSVKPCTAVDAAGAGNVVSVELEYGVEVDTEPMRRGFHANSSCGVCGKARLDQLRRPPPLKSDGFRVSSDMLAGLPPRMRSRQTVFERTGGLHAAAVFDGDGALLCLREDVGRHNAVDKVIGWAALAGQLPLDEYVLLVSGRSGFEIIQKALYAQIPIVASVSAASSLAVRTAADGGQTLVGFLRGWGMTVYCGGQRLRHQPA